MKVRTLLYQMVYPVLVLPCVFVLAAYLCVKGRLNR